PTASIAQNAVPVKSKTSVSFKVTWKDDTAIKVSSLSNGDVKVTGPHQFSSNATLISKTTNSNAKSITATYKISAPRGKWNSADNGTYTITIRPKEVSDTSGNFVASGKLATFNFSARTKRNDLTATMEDTNQATSAARSLFSLLTIS